MRFLSIDVGIKNLAYCLFDNNFSIIQWEVCNLCEDDWVCIRCGKKAKYTKKGVCYCKRHAKKEPFSIPNHTFSELKKMKLTDLRKMYPEHQRAKKRDLLVHIENDLSNNFFDMVQKKNGSNVDLVYVGKNLCEKLSKVGNVDYVLIENQIGPLANRMKTLQGMIMQYFIINGCENIRHISPLNKLSNFCEDKNTYKERKKLGIDITKKILLANNLFISWFDFFNKNKKKDDLADSFLQGISFFIKEKWIDIDNYLLRLT